MTAVLIDGRAVAQLRNAAVADEVASMRAAGLAPPNLHVILCGDDPASATYVRGKGRVAAKLGVDFTLHTPPADSTTEAILELLATLNAAPEVDGILVQLPLHKQIDAARVVAAVDPAKDADGFHPFNFGKLAEGHPGPALPATPAGCMELLRHYNIPIVGARAVIVGRSTIVGRPMAALLLNADATVTVCHSRTRDLADRCREADILILAMGRPGTVDASFIKPGACVIDVGTTPVDGTVRGDADFDSVSAVAGYLSPVPGGVGPMTIAMLMRNTLTLAQARRGGRIAQTAS